MVQLLTSLENETQLKSIERQNAYFEKKAMNFDRQREEIARSMQNLHLFNLQADRMTSITKKKLTDVMIDVEKHQAKTHEFVQQSNALLITSFEKVDFVRSENYRLHCGVPSFSIALPFNEFIAKAEETECELRSSSLEMAKLDDALKSEKEDLEKSHNSIAKSRGKAEKEMASLKEEHQRRSGIISDLQNSCVVNKKMISETTEEVCAATTTVEHLNAEIESARQARDSSLHEAEKISSLLENEEVLPKLKLLHSNLEDGNRTDVSIEAIPDCEEIAHLFGELELNKEFANTSQFVPNSSSLVVSNLEVSLENIKKKTKAVLKNIEQMKDYNNKYSINVELLARKKSGMETIKKQIKDNTAVLARMKVTENAVKPSDSESRNSKKEEVFRRLEASRNEVPGPEPYQPYLTPSHNLLNPSKLKAHTMKKVSSGSAATRLLGKSVVQYPGIELVQKSLKNTLVPRKGTSQEQNESIMSEDSSLISDDSGTTQDESMFNRVFSPLGNEKLDSPPLVEFSMAAHMNEYSQRQAYLKSSLPKIQKNDVNEKPALGSSAIDSDGEEEIEEDDDEGNDDEDLLAADDQEEYDQSVWDADD